MQCKCGSELKERTVQRKLMVIAHYKECPQCTRVLISKASRAAIGWDEVITAASKMPPMFAV